MEENERKERSNKISIDEYIGNHDLLQLTYIPFDNKLEIVSHIINGTIGAVGGLNTSLLRRVSTEAFIESITNIDMNIINESGLKGFDELLYRNELDNLVEILGNEYRQLQTILNEMVSDYIRTETNPSVTINRIYDQIKFYLSTAMDYISSQIQNIDVEELSRMISSINDKVGEQA